MRFRAALVSVLVLGSTAGCIFNIGKKARVDDPSASSGSMETRRLRYSLLVPFPQLAAAARSELQSMGATEREGVSSDTARFVVRDELAAGEDRVTLEARGTILVVTFTRHHVPKQEGLPENPGEEIVRKVHGNEPPQFKNPGENAKPNLPNTGAADTKSKDEAPRDEADATRRRQDHIATVILCLPGVGDLVDADGQPKERQLSPETRAAICHHDSIADAGAAPDAAPPPPAAPVADDAGPPPPPQEVDAGAPKPKKKKLTKK